MSARRLVLLVLAMLSAIALAACASIPTSSPVGHLDAPGSEAEAGGARAPDGPKPGAGAGEIVRGFLAAGAGAANNFAVARSFLAEGEAQEWNPQESVSLLPTRTDIDALNSSITTDQKTVTLTIPVVGFVDSSGIYNSTKFGTQSNMEFSLRQENGEWRISSAPDGLVISQEVFQTNFLNYSLEFFNSDFSALVPDSRWFLRSSSTPTAIINELLSGPAKYLAGAVVTAIPDGAKLGENVVTIEDGTAHVSLTDQDPAPTDREKGLIRKQIASTLKVIPSISNIELKIGSQTVSESLQPRTDATAQVDGPPVVLAKDRLSRISGTTVAMVENSPDLSKAKASDPAVSFDDSVYAYLAADGKKLMRLKANADEPTLVREGKRLVGPSIDRFNLIWTAEAVNRGNLIAIGTDGGESYEVGADFLSGRTVLDVEVSRDGTRVAVLSSSKSQPPRIDVAGIPRDKAGNPTTGLSATPIQVGSSFDEVKDIAWNGPTGLVALAAAGADQVQPVRIGVTGPPAKLGELPNGSRIAAGEDDRSILVTSDSGDFYSFNSNAWQKLVDISAHDPSYPG